MSHITEDFLELSGFFIENTLFFEDNTLDVSALEQKTEAAARSVLINSPNEFDEWDSLNADGVESLQRLNNEGYSELPLKGFAFEDDDRDDFDRSTQKTEIAVASVFEEKQSYKRKRSLELEEEQFKKSSHHRLNTEQQSYQTTSPCSIERYVLDEQDVNPDVFFDHSEKSVEQIGFDRWLCDIAPLIFDGEQTEAVPLKSEESSYLSLHPNENMDLNFSFSPKHQDVWDEHRSVRTVNPNSFFCDQALNGAEKSIEQMGFDARLYQMNPLRIDDGKIETLEPLNKSQSLALSQDEPRIATVETSVLIENETEASLSEANARKKARILEKQRLYERRCRAEFKERLATNPTEADLEKLEKGRKRSRDYQRLRWQNAPDGKNVYVKRMLKDNDLIERALTSSTTSPEEEQAKAILRKRKKTPQTVEEIERLGFSRNFRLVHLWLLNQPLAPDDEKEVKETLLDQIERYRKKRG
ncbi:MAG: hypothetical protein Q8L98_02865 [Chlamydiales bacterium]|nr:hypothetical protein [Chlamydiales bacterium]